MVDRDDRRERGDRDRGRRREPRFLVTSFEVSDPVKEGESWNLNAVAVAVFQDERGSRPPNPQRNILFDVGGVDIGTPQPTGRRDGRASIDFTLSEPGSYIVGAQIEDMPATRLTQKVVIKAERPKTPEELELTRIKVLVEKTKAESDLAELTAKQRPKPPTDLKVYAHPEGPASEYFISVELWGEGKVGIKWPLEIKDVSHPDASQRQVEVSTSDAGAYRFHVVAAEPREIFISAVGTPLDYALRLAGPRKKDTAPGLPDIPEEVLDEGLMATLRWYGAKAREKGGT